MASLSLVFDVLARDNASKTFKGIGDSAERAGKQGEGFGHSVSSGMKLAAGALAAAGIGTMFAGFVTDAAESAKISRLTEAAIKSTGGAAKITADQVSALATSISNKTAVDDEAIQSASNLLLTFTKVRNETGKGNDIFNQATQAAVDMSVVMGTDANSAALQLGKALNDPVKGVTALSRAGVSFTAQQKDQIKAMVAAGDTLGAQKLILAEMQTQFGGAAAAAADPLERLKVIAGNLGESIGGALLPVIEKFASFVTERVIPGVKALWDLLVTGDFTTAFREAFNVEEDSGIVTFLFSLRDTVITVFTEITGGIRSFAFAWIQNTGDVTSSGFPGFMERLGFAARQVFDYIKDTVIPALVDFAGWVQRNSDVILPFVAALGAGYVVFELVVGITKAWAAAQALLNAVMTANPIGIIIVALAALAAGLFVAYQNSETFRNIVDAAFRVVAEAGRWMWENVLQPVFASLGDLWSATSAGIAWAWDNLIKPAWAAVVAYVTFMWSNVLQPYFTLIWNLWTAVATGILWAWDNLIKPAWDLFSAVVTQVWNSVLSPIFTIIGATFNALAVGMLWAWDNILKPMFGFFSSTVNGLVGLFQTVVGAIQVAWSRLQDVAKAPVRFVIETVINNGLIEAFNKVVGWFGLDSWKVSKVPLPPGFAAGGRVPGWSPNDKADNIPAMLTAGEFVHPVSAVNYYGSDLMDRLRNREIPREELQYLATGGQIFDLARSAFPRAKLNSAYRPGDPGYHGRNQAADLGEEGFAGGAGRPYIAAMKRWFVDNYGRSNEIIYNGLGNDRTNIKDGKAFAYSAATQAEHRNHLHVAIAGALEAARGGPGGAAAFAGASASGAAALPGDPAFWSNPLGWFKAQIAGPLGQVANNPFAKFAAEIPGKLVSAAYEKVKGKVSEMLSAVAGDNSQETTVNTAAGPVKSQVQQVFGNKGWATGAQWSATDNIVQKESGWNPKAQNPSSTASGLFQHIRATWAANRSPAAAIFANMKDAPVAEQALAGMNYIARRYGTPTAAWAYWQAHGNYANGGLVKGIPSYATGTSYVPVTGPALLHQGEAVLTKEENRDRSRPATFTGNLYLDSGELLGLVRGEMDSRDADLARNARSAF